jgi:hypothetical protein
MIKLFRFDLLTVWIPYFGNSLQVAHLTRELCKTSNQVWTENAPILLSLCHDALVKIVPDCSRQTLKKIEESIYWRSMGIQFELTIHDGEVQDFLKFIQDCPLVIYKIIFTHNSEEMHNLIKVLLNKNYLKERIYKILFKD